MRDLVKSAGSYFLAQSLFAIGQAGNIFTPRERGRRKGPAALAFDGVTAATVQQLGRGLGAAFQLMDSGQRLTLGLAFNILLPFISNFGSASLREATWERMGYRPPRRTDGPLADLEDRAKASMEQEAKSLWE